MVSILNVKDVKFEVVKIYSSDITLTDEEYSALEEKVTEYKASDSAGRSDIIKEAADLIKKSWARDDAFNRKHIESVCVFLGLMRRF